jgi:hypothetical protein
MTDPSGAESVSVDRRIDGESCNQADQIEILSAINYALQQFWICAGGACGNSDSMKRKAIHYLSTAKFWCVKYGNVNKVQRFVDKEMGLSGETGVLELPGEREAGAYGEFPPWEDTGDIYVPPIARDPSPIPWFPHKCLAQSLAHEALHPAFYAEGLPKFWDSLYGDSGSSVMEEYEVARAAQDCVKCP